MFLFKKSKQIQFLEAGSGHCNDMQCTCLLPGQVGSSEADTTPVRNSIRCFLDQNFAKQW
jgi:hypothetical protein